MSRLRLACDSAWKQLAEYLQRAAEHVHAHVSAEVVDTARIGAFYPLTIYSLWERLCRECLFPKPFAAQPLLQHSWGLKTQKMVKKRTSSGHPYGLF